MSKNGNPFPNFNIIRYRGQPSKATTLDGYNVERQENFFVDEPGWNIMVKAADYSDHFIYENPGYKAGKLGHHKYMCTCGSEGVITGRSAFKKDTSTDDAALIICKYHATYGVHATGGNKWI